MLWKLLHFNDLQLIIKHIKKMFFDNIALEHVFPESQNPQKWYFHILFEYSKKREKQYKGM